MKSNFFKIHGGKFYLAKWIISHFPSNYENLIYLEPFLGAGNVLLQKQPSKIEMANDIDLSIYCLWSELKAKRLLRVKTLYWSENIFNWYKNKTCSNNWQIAEREYVLRNMSRGGLKKDFSQSSRLRGGQNEGKNAWENKVKNLNKIYERIKNISLSNSKAIDFMKLYNNHLAFVYLDPPYLQETRTTKNVYDYEMNNNEHEELLNFLTKEWKGKFLLSGYESKLYNDKLNNCSKYIKQIANHSGQNKVKNQRVEALWKNY